MGRPLYHRFVKFLTPALAKLTLIVAFASAFLFSAKISSATVCIHDLKTTLQRILEDDFIIPEPLPAPFIPFKKEPKLTAADFLKQKMAPLTVEDLTILGIKPHYHKYYDLRTGRFHYVNSSSAKLAVENGDTNLGAIKLQWSLLEKEISQAAFEDVIRALEKMPDVKLWLVTERQALPVLREQVALLPKPIQERIILVDNDGYLRLWAQDGSKPLDEFGKILVPPKHTQYIEYEIVIDLLKDKGIVKPQISPFRFDGGNVVVGSKNVFVGSAVVESAMNDYKISRGDAIKALSEEFGKPVIELPQVDFHIDLTMAIARDRHTGQEVIFLDSPKTAVEVLLGPEIIAQMPKEPKAFFDKLIGGETKVTTQGEHDLEAFLSDPSYLKSQLFREERIQALAKMLKAEGYRVESIPGMSVGKTSNTRVIFNYTNSIFSGKHAIVPQNGVRAWDEYVFSKLRELGYEPIPAPVVQKSLCLRGGIRCLTETHRQK